MNESKPAQAGTSLAGAQSRPLSRLRRRAKRLKRQVWAMFLALKGPGTPLLAKAVIVCAVAYAISPIDLIPDFIPILGQLDDLVILPLLIALALRMIPSDVAARCRREAWKHLASGERIDSRLGMAAAAAFSAAWIGVAAWILSILL